MILYFSATGNCKFVAHTIAKATGEKAVSIQESSEKIMLKEGESLGIITPTYFWGLPTFVDDFFSRVRIEQGEDSYIYYIATYGTTPGQTDYFIKQHLKRQRLTLSASFSVKTVDNWTVWFDVSDRETICQQLCDEKEQIDDIVKSILSKEKVFIQKRKMPLLFCKVAQCLYEGARKTSHFLVNERCISCGLCAKLCPEQAIQMDNGKPRWLKEKCTMCLGCLHNCPGFAIQYGKKTEKHGQYSHPQI